MKLQRDFFERDALTVGKELVGKILVRNIDGVELRSKIVEVESYTGEDDKACHTFGGKRTNRTETMYKSGGHIYIYLIYGMYELMNFVTGDDCSGEAVLIRGVEPLNHLDIIANNRFQKNYGELSNYQKKNLTNGPGKLTKALKIDRNLNGTDLFGNDIYVEDNEEAEFEIVESKRIGIDYAEEARDYLYRFYIKDNRYVSVK